MNALFCVKLKCQFNLNVYIGLQARECLPGADRNYITPSFFRPFSNPPGTPSITLPACHQPQTQFISNNKLVFWYYLEIFFRLH